MTRDIMRKSDVTEKLRILITGACGSIGSVLVKRLLNDGHTVCAFDHSEDGLFKIDQLLKKKYDDRLKLFLGDIRDESRVHRAMAGIDIIFHCAALKHVYLSEYNPFEAMLTNIVGTNNIIQAAIASDVEKVIITSSDKAVNPTSTMGATKLLGERLFIAANNYAGSHKTKFSCVRFGNVLNSNGSVLQIFKNQLKNKLPLTITSRDMTRFFLTMSQAVDLCMEAAIHMIGGEIFVKSMGSCDIMQLAKAVSGDQPFNFTEIGLKPGEKLYEELVTESEAPRTVVADNIFVVLPDTIDMMPEELRSRYAVYDNSERLTAPLRSDDQVLSQSEVVSLLGAAGLVNE